MATFCSAASSPLTAAVIRAACRGKMRRKKAAPLARERRVPCPAVFVRHTPLDQPFLLQAIDEKGDPAARHQDALLDIAEQRLTAVVEQLQHRELADRESLLAHIGDGMLLHGIEGAGERYPELERDLLIGGKVGGGRRSRVAFGHISQ